jgi:hypothetical protein
VLAVCAALITLASSGGPYPHDRGQRLFLAFVICGLIAALRHWPLPVLAAATLANTMVMAAGNAPLPFGIVLGLASYLAASRLPRRVSIPAAAAELRVVLGLLRDEENGTAALAPAPRLVDSAIAARPR